MSEGYVYFALQEDDLRWRGRVKIGWAKDPSARIRELQVGNPFRLKLIGQLPGTREAERWVHDQLREHRTGGEWFLLLDGITLGDVVGFALDAIAESLNHLELAA
jgi:hypothetical protein